MTEKRPSENKVTRYNLVGVIDVKLEYLRDRKLVSEERSQSKLVEGTTDVKTSHFLKTIIDTIFIISSLQLNIF